MTRDDKRLGLGIAVVAAATIALAWTIGLFPDNSPQPAPEPRTTTAAPVAPAPAPVPAARPQPAGPPCTVPADVLPPPRKVAGGAVSTSGDAGQWVMTGLIFRCAQDGSQSVDIQTPPEMGVTASAALQMAVTGVRFWPENEATENRPTSWSLVDAPTISVKDPDNADPAKNVVTVSWQTDLSRIISYELTFLIYFDQKASSR